MDAEVASAPRSKNNQTTGSAEQRQTMYSVWKKNSLEKHILSDVVILEKDARALTETTLQYCVEQEVEMPNGRVETHKVLPKCQYSFPPEPKKKVVAFVAELFPRKECFPRETK